MSSLAASSVSFSYTRKEPVLQRVDWEASGPGLIVVLGPNGAGKTTLLRILTTSMAPQEGDISFGGRSLEDPRTLREFRSRLGFVPQDSAVFPRLTVHRFLRYVSWLKLIDEREVDAEVGRVLELVDIVELEQRRIQSLSGGQTRRVALAQALLGNPSVLVLDEPTAGLDPVQRVHVRAMLRDLARRALVVWSTHMVDEALQADRIDILDQGTIRTSESPQELCGSEMPTVERLERAYVTRLTP